MSWLRAAAERRPGRDRRSAANIVAALGLAVLVALLTATLLDRPKTHSPWRMSEGAAGIALVAAAVLLYQRGAARQRATAAELTRARGEAEHAGRVKAQFLTTMSHEMRTPVNGIIGTASLLLETPLAADQRTLAIALKESAEGLLQLVNDVLDFSKMEAAGLKLQNVAFAPRAAAEAVIDRMRPHAARKGLELALAIAADVPRRVTGDPDRFRQVLFNLVSNGIKFTEAGGVFVEMARDGSDDDRVTLVVTVRDTGIGIDPAQLPLLFQEFVQLDGSISRRFRGTGLGLALCDRLTRLMGGTISVESAPGRGSRFRFTLTVARADAADAAPASAPEASAEVRRGGRLLLAEDDETNRLIATRVLTSAGYVVVSAPDGKAAVAAARAGGYDLVLMDVMMPEMDGLAATRAIRALPPPLGEVPILGLTANPEYAAAGGDAGMTGFVSKPFTPADLKESVAAALAHVAAAPRASAALVRRAAEDAAALFDPTRLRALTDEIGAASARDLVEIFLADSEQRLVQMRRLAGGGEGDAKALARAAHSIKSSAATFGFERLAALARAIESAPAAEATASLVDSAAAALAGGRSAWKEAAL